MLKDILIDKRVSFVYTVLVSTNIQGGNMKKLLNKILGNWPFKVLFVTTVIIALLAIGITNVNLSTGNETLIDETSDLYADNLEYQTIFGTDPIILVVENEDVESLVSYTSLEVINNLNSNIENLDGVFYVNGPISVIDYIGSVSVENYQLALNEISSALLMISSNIRDMQASQPEINSELLSTSLGNIITAQENITTGLENEVALMNSMMTNVSSEIQLLTDERNGLDPVADETEYQNLTRTMTVLTNINNLYGQMISLSESFSEGTSQTSVGLQSTLTQLSTVFTTFSNLNSNLSTFETTLTTLGNTVGTLAANFNGFTYAFPTEESTLNQMVYPDGVNINPMLQSFILDDTHMYISIVLEEGTDEAQMEVILNEINEVLEGTIYEDSLVSGKPVLNYDIKSSMMDSMKIMMISAAVIMVLVLLILFPVSFRLLPLVVVLIAVVGTIGVMGHLDITLTMVSMAVFPVLIGLGIDYSIQFQSRYLEELEGGTSNE